MSKDTARKAKAKAKKLLTKFVNQIALEQHGNPEIIDGDAIVVTKAEALARLMWNEALGYIEQVDIIDSKTGQKLGRKPVVHPPDKTYVTMLYDRMEGRVPTIEVKQEDNKATLADKVSKQSKNRLNNLAKK